MRNRTIIVMLAIVALAAMASAQSRDTGAIVGKVVDDQKNSLPGVTVTLTGKNLMGQRDAVTDAQGSFRFPALPPGDYTVKAVLANFKTYIQEAIRVTTTVSLNLEIVMAQAAIAEEITVQAKSPTIDIKSTETASVTLSNEILRNIPYSQFTSDIVNLAPGVVNNVAFGASQSTGIAYTIDGVNVADPEAGSAWVFMDHNTIEEAKIMGVGVPAEYGNFTGVIFNLVTKTGGNAFSGHMEFNFQGKKSDGPKGLWQTDNNAAYLEDFPNLSSPLTTLMDLSGHLGGPITKDKLWFYTGAQYYRSQNFPTGFPEAVDYKQPRWFGKLTAALSTTLTMNATLELDTYNGINRGAGSTVDPDATVNQKSPEIVTHVNLTKILSSSTFVDLKTAYFWGYYYLDPETGLDVNAWNRMDENGQYRLEENAGSYFYADRSRFQTNASLTHYAEDFIKGNHDFKFGVEVERSSVRNRFGYTGANHTVYWDYYGANYLAYQYEGYDTNTRYTRFEGFAQDSWQITDRLNLSVGVRFSQNWGQVKGVDGSVYTSTRLAPRLGLTFDVLGDKSTVLKAHYGQYTEAMLSSYHDRMNPASAYKDYISYYWDGEWVEFDRTIHENLYRFADDIKHPYLNQFTVGLERELFRDTSLGITYINREWKNIIGQYDTLSTYVPRTVNVSLLNKAFTIYERTSGSAHDYVLTNIQKGDSPWILADPYRKYWGLEFVFNKRFSNRWQLLASYVYAKAFGTLDNGFADDVGWGARDGIGTDDPNYWLNADGNSTFDPTHQIKIQGSYIIPWVEVALNVYYQAITGNSWTTRVRTSRFAQGRVTFLAEPRGSNHYPMTSNLDVRLEKLFTLGGRYRLGLIVDVFNVFNTDTLTAWGTRIGYDWFPGDYASTDGHQLYSIVRPRQARVGVRVVF